MGLEKGVGGYGKERWVWVGEGEVGVGRGRRGGCG